MWDKIIRWWHYTWIRNAYRNCRDGITNLWKWAPVIWQDRDWDHYYIYAVLIHKLEKQATYIQKNGFHVEARRDAEKMFLCAKLARMLQQEFYIDEFRDIEKHNRARRLLFKIMEQNIERWWD